MNRSELELRMSELREVATNPDTPEDRAKEAVAEIRKCEPQLREAIKAEQEAR